MYQVFHLSLSIRFCLKIWFFSSPWNHGVMHGHILRAPSRSNERRTAFGVIFSFDPNVASLWWRTPTSISVCSSLSWTPSGLVFHISPNSRTLVILLQVNLAFGDELEIVCEGFYDTGDTSIFAWSLVLSVGHYHWLRGPIRRLPPNSKANHLIRTIQRILYFVQLWTITMA
jgi:hypothetical protein